ncbi:MAG: TMEM165/GDT1 family protein [Nitrososphaeria archaeon]|nr:TMEM165/GDT1 family protein [Nitrososphaeria archaeon]
MKYKRFIPIILGTSLGFLFVDSIAVVLGLILTSFIPLQLVRIFAGIVFIIFGIYFYIMKDEEFCPTDNKRSPFLASFTLISTTEMGDKTQLMVIALATAFNNPLQIISGAMLALVAISSITLFLGSKLLGVFPVKRIKLIIPIIFIIVGVLQILFNE